MPCVVIFRKAPETPPENMPFPEGAQAQVLPSVIQRVVAGGW